MVALSLARICAPGIPRLAPPGAMVKLTPQLAKELSGALELSDVSKLNAAKKDIDEVCGEGCPGPDRRGDEPMRPRAAPCKKGSRRPRAAGRSAPPGWVVPRRSLPPARADA